MHKCRTERKKTSDFPQSKSIITAFPQIMLYGHHSLKNLGLWVREGSKRMSDAKTCPQPGEMGVSNSIKFLRRRKRKNLALLRRRCTRELWRFNLIGKLQICRMAWKIQLGDPSDCPALLRTLDRVQGTWTTRLIEPATKIQSTRVRPILKPVWDWAELTLPINC